MSSGTLPATTVIASTVTSGCRSAISSATASSDAVSVSIRNGRVRTLEELVLAAEDRRDGVVGEDVHDRLCEQLRDGQHRHVLRHLELVDRHGVGDDDAVDRRVVELLERTAAEDAVRREDPHALDVLRA